MMSSTSGSEYSYRENSRQTPVRRNRKNVSKVDQSSRYGTPVSDGQTARDAPPASELKNFHDSENHQLNATAHIQQAPLSFPEHLYNQHNLNYNGNYAQNHQQNSYMGNTQCQSAPQLNRNMAGNATNTISYATGQFFVPYNGNAQPPMLQPPMNDYQPVYEQRQPNYPQYYVDANCTQRRETDPGKVYNNYSQYVNFSPRDVVELLPVYSGISGPMSECVSVRRWVDTVENIKTVYNINDFVILYAAKCRLKGNALLWYESVAGVIGSWSQFKFELIREFDRSRDPVDVHSELANRRKRDDESYTEYIYKIRKLASEINLDDQSIIKYVIKGLRDSDERVRCALALQDFHSVSELLARVRKFENLITKKNDKYSRKDSRYDFQPSGTGQDCDRKNVDNNHRSANFQRRDNNIRCFKCNGADHLARDCKKKLTCSYCKGEGHYEVNCPSKNKKITSDIRRLEFNESEYIKYVKVNDCKQIRAFIDLGSDIVTIKSSIANELNLQWQHCNQILKGFGNNFTSAVGKVKISLNLDDIKFSVDAFVVDDRSQTEPIMIGRSVLDRDGILVIKAHNLLNIFQVPVGNLNINKNRNATEFLLNFNNTDNDDNEVVSTENDESDESSNVKNFKLCFASQPTSSNDELALCERKNNKKIGSEMIHEHCYDISNLFNSGESENNYDIAAEIGNGDFSENVTGINLNGKIDSINNFVFNDENKEKLNKFDNVYDTSCDAVSAFRQPYYEKVNVKPINSTKKVMKINKFIYSDISDELLKTTIDSNIDDKYWEQFKSLIRKYRDCFALNINEVGKTDKTEIKINLNSDDPVNYHPYRISATQRENVRAQINNFLEMGIIKHSSSDYASPIVIVKKKNGEDRICVDYRSLNSKTIKDRFPIPNIEDSLQRLASKKYFSVLDLASGYYQIPVAESSKKYTAFVTPEGQFEFERMPFGLTNAPAVFQRLMNRISNELDNRIVVYLDDIILPSKTISEGMELLEDVLIKLREYGLTLKLSKCRFLLRTVEYLGHEISEQGIKPGKDKISCVEKFPIPRNVHEVRQFIGLASYFRKFVSKFSLIAEPLTRLTRKNSSFQWLSEQELAFQTLKNKLCHRDILVLYDNDKNHEIHTDASAKGLAGVLLQKETDGELHPVCYFSRKTTDVEMKFHSYELEALAVVESLEKFKSYVLGKTFDVVTDCSALKTASSKRDISPRIARWWLRLLEFDFNVKHRQGKSMAHVDALSRSPVGDPKEVEPASLDVFKISSVDMDWVEFLQSNDPEILKIKQNISDPKNKDYVINNGKVYRKMNDRILFVVPAGVRGRILYHCHDEMGHFGLARTLAIVNEVFWWPRMRQFLKKYLDTCVECLYHRENRESNSIELHPIEKVPRPFHTWHIDHLGPFVESPKRNRYIVVLVDAFTKYIHFKPVRDTSSRFVIKVLGELSTFFGFPARLVTDRGSAFTSKSFTAFCKDNKVEHVLNATATPRANGQVERYNRTLLHSLRTMSDKEQVQWESKLPEIQWTLNSSPHNTTKLSPHQLMYGVTLRSPIADKLQLEILDDIPEKPFVLDDRELLRAKASQRINEKQEKQKKSFDMNHKTPKKYKVGDYVVVFREPPSTGESKKLARRFRGPYKITSILYGDRYRVEETINVEGRRRFKGVVPADHLRLVVPREQEDINESASESED